MVNFYRENGVLFVESRMDLRFPIVINGVSHTNKEHESFEDVDLVYALLERNGRILIKDEDRFKRFSLGEFADIISLKKYNLVEGLPSITAKEKKEDAILECFPPQRDYQKLREQGLSVMEDEKITHTKLLEEKKIVEDEPIAENEPAPVQKQQEQQNHNKKRNKERQYNNNEQKQTQNNNVNPQKGDAK